MLRLAPCTTILQYSALRIVYRQVQHSVYTMSVYTLLCSEYKVYTL